MADPFAGFDDAFDELDAMLEKGDDGGSAPPPQQLQQHGAPGVGAGGGGTFPAATATFTATATANPAAMGQYDGNGFGGGAGAAGGVPPPASSRVIPTSSRMPASSRAGIAGAGPTALGTTNSFPSSELLGGTTLNAPSGQYGGLHSNDTPQGAASPPQPFVSQLALRQSRDAALEHRRQSLGGSPQFSPQLSPQMSGGHQRQQFDMRGSLDSRTQAAAPHSGGAATMLRSSMGALAPQMDAGNPDLLSQQWYCGSMPRPETEALLRSTQAKCFVVRDSQQGVGWFALSVFDPSTGQCVHTLVEKRADGFVLATFGDPIVRPTVSAIVEHASTTPGGQLVGIAPVNATAYAGHYLQTCNARAGVSASASPATTPSPVMRSPGIAQLQRQNSAFAGGAGLMAHLQLPLLNCTKTVMISETETPNEFRARAFAKYYEPKLAAAGKAHTSEQYALQVPGIVGEYLDVPGDANAAPLASLLPKPESQYDKVKVMLVERQKKPNPLAEFSWFSPAESRAETEELLGATRANCFLVRESSQENCYALSQYLHSGQFVHLLIVPAPDGGFMFEGRPEMSFPSIKKLVSDCGELDGFVSIGDVSRRAHIATEIYRTEMDYIAGLRVLTEVFLQTLRVNRAITEAEVEEIFSNIESILPYHTHMSNFLRERAELTDPSEICMGDVFIKYAEAFKMYAVFATNFERGLALVKKKMASDTKFRKAMESAAQDERCALDFQSYYIMPIQRVPRYELLLRDMIKVTWGGHKDFQNLENAVSMVKQAASHINDYKAEQMSSAKLQEVQARLKGAAGSGGQNIVEAGRLYIREGPLDLKRLPPAKPAPKYVFLFSDLLLVTSGKLKKGTLKKIDDEFRIRLLGASMTRLGELDISITDDVGDDITLSCLSKPDCSSWCADIERVIAAASQKHLESTNLGSLVRS